MTITMRGMTISDRLAWTRMRRSLWPDEMTQGHAAEIDAILNGDDAWAFVAETAEGMPVGFAEVSVRKAANGCESQPVPFLEGIWLEPQYRRQGIGGRLIGHIENFIKARGFSEIGSDTPIENQGSQNAHKAWGFSETERVVYFRKCLRDTGARG
jgi:aminoglycoside 6'-N-acetyltransferase I